MDCPECGEPDMILYPGGYFDDDDRYGEPDAYECPECGHVEVV